MRSTYILRLAIGIFISLPFSSCNESIELTDEEKNWLASQDTISVSVFPYYAPYQFRNKAGEIDGIFVDYLELIEEKIDYEFHRREYTHWPDVLEDARSGNLDIVLEIQQTKSRKEYLQFYDLFFESPQSLVTLKSDTGSRLKDFKGKVLTLPVDYAIVESIKKDYPYLKIKTETNDSICLAKLNQGLYDAYIGPRAVVNHFKESDRLNYLKIVDDLPYLYAPDIGVAKNNKMLNQIFRKATRSITAEERLKIQDSWLFFEVKPYYKTTAFWSSIAVMIGILLLLTILFNYYLKYLVKKKTEQLRISRQNAVESNELRQEFIKNISHEIRTPLNAIIGFSKILKKEGYDNSESYITNIKEGTKSLEKILTGIKEVSELQTQQIEIKQAEVQIEKLISKVIIDYEATAQEKNIDLRLESAISGESKLIRIDGDKLARALSILVEKIINYSENKTVLISYKFETSTLQILIKGAAIGHYAIGKDYRFKNFSQLQKRLSKRLHSLGLGLTMAREHIVLLNGGINYITNKKGQSCFEITIPYNQA